MAHVHRDLRKNGLWECYNPCSTVDYKTVEVVYLNMPSDADMFEADLESFKEFVDDDGRHFYVMQFTDGSGRVFRKHQSEDDYSIAEFTLRDRYASEALRKIASATDFEFDEDANTQQNLRNLMK